MQVKLILKFKSILFDYLLTPGRTGKIHTPTMVQGRVDGTSPPPPPPPPSPLGI